MKKGVSPVIATVLLVAMVIVIALIIFLWFQGIGGEVITKFGGTNIELVCNDVAFESQYVNGELSISNIGNVPIFGMKVRIESEGSHQTKDLRDISSWPSNGLGKGSAFSDNIGSVVGSANNIILTPILLGSSDKGERAYMCNEDQYGYSIEIV